MSSIVLPSSLSLSLSLLQTMVDRVLRERAEKATSQESTDIMEGEYLVGVVDSVEPVSGVAQVRVWQSGNRLLKDRPVHAIPTRLLTW